MTFQPVGKFKTSEQFREYLSSNNIDIQFDDAVITGVNSSLNTPYLLKDGFIIGNRFCIQPMEGWDGTPDGKPGELTFRRWKNFGRSGAKLIWGGEAVAVDHAGRANPNQLLINPDNLPFLSKLREALVENHRHYYSKVNDLLIGLQLTHSGRFSRPNSKTKPEPIIVYHHPYLDQKVGIPPDYPVITPSEINQLIDLFILSAKLAKSAGFDFVDIKACHGYLGHEFLSAYSRNDEFGGSFENRTRFLRTIIQGIQAEVPNLRIGVRISIFDFPVFLPNPNTRVGEPIQDAAYPRMFGVSEKKPLEINLAEPIKLLNLLKDLGVELINITAGSPYYNPHIQRPAFFPPSDGYHPPEDPLQGVARHIKVCAELKQYFPDMLIVGSAYTYLQEWLPNVAQFNVYNHRVDFIGLGRMVLSYPEFANDVLSGKQLNKHAICRTFSDCTTAPRHGLVSGCYPLDSDYRKLPDYEKLLQVKGRKSSK